MSPIHSCLALLVIFIWGCNFIFIKFCLTEFSPIFLCAVRFFLASFPAILFIKWPAAPFKWIAAYGLLTFGLQFACLFIGMNIGMTPGLASLLLQVQIFFSLFFAMLFLGEIPGIWQIGGALVSFIGIGLVATHLDSSISLASFLMVMGAAASWGLGNLISKKIGSVNMIALVVWGSFVACFPLLLLSLLFEGTSSIQYTLHHISWKGTASLFYIVYASTWVGYGVWNWLLSRYTVGTVVPYTLLVPVIGILSSVLVLGESFQSWKLIAGLFIITGLFINLFGSRVKRVFAKLRST